MMKIGIPKALLYYKYKDLWLEYFKNLDVEVVLSPDTNKKIMKNGIKYSIDESCLSAKIFIGHVHYLINKCDFILVPRIASVKKNEELCTKFYALPDIVNNTFPDVDILNYNIDVKNKQTEKKAFLEMGKFLGYTKKEISNAYKKAKNKEKKIQESNIKKQNQKLNTNKIKILVVSHVYNIEDDYIGSPLIKYLESLDVTLIFANIADQDTACLRSKNISKSLYWTYNKELIGGIEIYKDYVDGIILISSFPCGPDSLVNDLVIRKIKDIPITYIVVDELDGNAGMHTRLESFVDILRIKKGE